MNPTERPTAANSPFLISGRWYREHPFELLEAELNRRGLHVPVDHDLGQMAVILNADDAAVAGGGG
jgi:hypothetical protein